MPVYLGWMVAAFFGEFLVALWLRGKRHALRENFARVTWFQGAGLSGDLENRGGEAELRPPAGGW